MIRKLIKTLCIGFLCLGNLQAQDYNWSASLDSVAQDGFYKVILIPEITEKILDKDYSDLRLYDQQGRETPYLLQEEWNNDKKWFQEYSILSKENSPERFTKVIIHNPKKNSIDNFSLVVKNNNAYKTAKLSGSDDNQNWFFITDHYQLSQMYDQQMVVSEKRIDFPLSNYEYYKLEIDDSASAPVNILKIGYYISTVETAQQTLLSKPTVVQSEKINSKSSHVKFSFSSNFYINTLSFEIEGPKFYKRHAILYRIEGTHLVDTLEELSFDLMAGASHILSTPELYGKDFLMVIENGDNEPLRIKNIKAFQKTHYLVSYLQSKGQYVLFVGNNTAKLPQYDLASFRDSIPAILPEVKPGSFKFIKKEKVKVEVKEEWFKSKIWIWSALAIVLALLGFISYRMIKEMDKK